MDTKVCKVCGLEKEIDSFRKRDKWYMNVCRQCENEQTKKRQKENRDKYYIAQKKYREEHKEHYRELNRQWYADNKEKVLDTQKRVYAKHKELNDDVYLKKKAYKKKYREEHSEEIALQLAEWRKNNTERIKQYRLDHSDERKEYMDNYRKENSEELKAWRKEYRLKNLDRIKEYMDIYREENKDSIKEYNKNYKDDNKEVLMKKALEYYHKRRKEDPLFRLKVQVRNVVRNSFNRKGTVKRRKTEELLGCSIDDFANHLLKSFFDNYGYEWDGVEEVHIDHIVPLATADTEEEVIKLCHYTNLQLLKAKDNLEKRDNLDWELLK
jgi:hypothetical protein